MLETCRGLCLLSNRCNCKPMPFFVDGKLFLSLVHQFSLELNLLSLYYQKHVVPPRRYGLCVGFRGFLQKVITCINIHFKIYSKCSFLITVHIFFLHRLHLFNTPFLLGLFETYIYKVNINFCLFGIFRPTREFFTHMETSPLLVKGCKF